MGAMPGFEEGPQSRFGGILPYHRRSDGSSEKEDVSQRLADRCNGYSCFFFCNPAFAQARLGIRKTYVDEAVESFRKLSLPTIEERLRKINDRFTA